MKDFTNDISTELDTLRTSVEIITSYIRAKSSIFKNTALEPVWKGLQNLLPDEDFDESDKIVDLKFNPHLNSNRIVEEDDEDEEDEVFDLKPLSFQIGNQFAQPRSVTHPSRSSFSLPAPSGHANVLIYLFSLFIEDFERTTTC